MIEHRYRQVYTPGLLGQVWDQEWVFDRCDDGAARIQFHSDFDGLLITIAIGGDFDGGIHPYVIYIDGQGGPSEIRHNNTLIARVERTPMMVHGVPTWAWFRFLHGRVWFGFGEVVGENVVIGGKTPHPLMAMYRRYGVGRTGNNGAFEVIDCQPLSRRLRKRWD